MHRNRPSLRGIASLALAGLAAVSCGGDTPSGGPGASGGGARSLVFARGKDSEHLDPAIVDDGESVKVITNVFDTLIAYKAGTLELTPGLAERWSASKDSLTWTFHLREAKFHDGTPVDAEAVVFSFERQKDPAHPAHTDACPYWDGFFGTVTGVRAVDPRTVEMSLSAPLAPFEAMMTLFSMSIVSPTAWKSEGVDPATGKYRYDFAQKPVGSGPFRFVRWTRDDTILLERNPDWWGGAPQIDKLWFKTITDNTQRLLAVEGGQADLMDGMNPQDVARVKRSATLVLDQQPGLNIGYLAMNVTKPPFDDVRVREAVALAIDKRTLLASAYDGTGDVAPSAVPRALMFWKQRPDRAVDRERAKRLLAEAGHGAGLSFKLNAMDNPRTYMPRPKDVAIQIQQDLAAIGVRVELEVLAWTRHRDDISNARHQACLLGWMADYGDADNFLATFFDKENARIGSALNAAFYTDETVHGWLTKARTEMDRAERARIYELVEEKVAADVPLVPLVTMPELRVRSSRVKGYAIYPAGGEYLARVTVE